MQQQKFSRQREEILRELRARKDHPTAETLYLSLKDRFPALSLATVYRNLSQLCEAGLAQKISGKGADHFDGVTAAHTHLTCSACGSVFDLEFPAPPCLGQLDDLAARNFAGTVHGHRLQFFGLCPACSPKP
ncbi:MAG: transcriptional repressor [Oscillospiraceae bacterium]|nr:transcriptional repressor [Oscillospiraceae bacterium]